MASLQSTREQELQWKFRWESTTELEYKLVATNWLTEAEQRDIEFELVRRGSTFCRKYFDQSETKIYGKDGSSVSFGSAANRPYKWDRMIAAEKEWMDEILTQPIKVDDSAVAKWINNETKHVVRRVVPGLITMATSGIQPMPMNPHVSDLQKIGRSQRPEPNTKPRIIDYMSLLQAHTSEMPKTNLGLSELMKLNRNEGQTIRFLDTEAPQYYLEHWIQTEVADEPYSKSKELHLEQALARPWLSDTLNKGILSSYSEDQSLFDTNLCPEVPTSRSSFSDIWRLHLEASALATKSLYYKPPAAFITATAPCVPADYGSIACAPGIEPIRRQDFFSCASSHDTEIIHLPSTPATGELTFKVAKHRPATSESMKFDIAKIASIVNWAKQEEESKDHVAETLAILGITKGEPK